MSAALKIVQNVPNNVTDLSALLTEVNLGKVISASRIGDVLKVDFYNWQGHLFVRRNQSGNLVYNIGREVVNYKTAPLTFNNLQDAISVLCSMCPYPTEVDRKTIMLDLAKVIHEFALRQVR